MINSTGFQNRLVFSTILEMIKSKGSTGSYCGPAEQKKKVRKCNACGHSHT